MWLPGPVAGPTPHRAAPSRRSVLRGALVLPLTVPLVACTGEDRPAAPDPDDALRAAAAQREVALLQAYDALLATSPARAAVLAALRAEHADHLAAR